MTNLKVVSLPRAREARSDLRVSNRLGIKGARTTDLWVGNLPAATEKVWTDLWGIFRRFGPVEEIILQRSAGGSSYFAYITFLDEEAVEAALKAAPVYFYRTHMLKVARRRN
jgi:RNA recognition motif-containing protein